MTTPTDKERADAAEARVRVLEEALQFYADYRSYISIDGRVEAALVDDGSRARAASGYAEGEG